MSVRRCTAVLLAILSWGLVAEVVSAQSSATRAIVLRFEGGRRGDRAREAAVLELAPHVELVTEDHAIAAAEEMGVDVSSPGGMSEVVQELGVTLIVTGSVSGRRRDASTTIVVVNPDGDELARREGPEPRGAAAMAEIGRVAVEAVDAAVEALEERDRAARAAATPDPVQQIVYDDEGDEDEDEEPGTPRTGWRHPLAVALVGTRLRTMGTYVDEEATNTQHFFASDLYPEIELAVAFRPLTDAADELARGLYIGAVGSFSVGLTYLDASSPDARAMTSFRFRADVGYGYTVADVFEISGVVGFGIEGVDFDAPTAFPSTMFAYVRPAVVGRARLFEDLFALEFSVGGRIGVDGGALPEAFGPGFAFGGVDVGLGFYGVVAPGFSWAARVNYAFHALSFDGGGGTFGAGGSGRDETVGLHVLVGWAF